MLIVYRSYRDFFVVISLVSLTLFVLHRSVDVYNFRNIEMLRMGEVRKARTLNIFKYKDAVKWIDTVCVCHFPQIPVFRSRFRA